MAKEKINNTEEEVMEQQNAAPEQTANQPEAPVEPEKEAKHPKLDAFKTKAKKIGKWVGLGAAVVGGLFVANKIGQAQGQALGFDQACDSFAKTNPDPLPELTTDTSDIGLDITTEPVSVDIPETFEEV